MSGDRREERLFLYAAMRDPAAQRAVLGRALGGEPAVLSGYRTIPVRVHDERVVAAVGAAAHIGALPTGDPRDKVFGVAAYVDETDLHAVDDLDEGDYHRLRVVLDDGEAAWAYVAFPREHGTAP